MDTIISCRCNDRSGGQSDCTIGVQTIVAGVNRDLAAVFNQEDTSLNSLGGVVGVLSRRGPTTGNDRCIATGDDDVSFTLDPVTRRGDFDGATGDIDVALGGIAILVRLQAVPSRSDLDSSAGNGQ